MVRIHLTAADFARVRFAARPAPLQELNVALLMMMSRNQEILFGRWRRRSRLSLPSAAMAIRDLVPGHVAPAFMDVFSDSLPEGFDVLRGTPQSLLRAEIERAYRATTTAPPAWVRDLHRGRIDAWRPLLRAQQTAFDSILGPVWPMVQDLHHAEFARHALTTAEHGLAGALAAIVPAGRLHETMWELPGFDDSEIELCGRGMLLLPTFHWTGDPLISCLPDRPLVVTYAAGPGLPLPRTAPGGTGQALSEVIGRTRLDILLLLEDEHSTSQLAQRLNVSNATASTHTGALRRAGLIASVRAGRAVCHQRTPLGTLLVARHP